MYTDLSRILHSASKITVLTGAGMSTASGIPDFRSQNGIYTKQLINEISDSLIPSHLPVERILSESFFHKHPELFWKCYKQIFNMANIDLYQPNFGHLYLKQLEDLGKRITIITQNIDGLHQKAGSTDVIEVHGNLHQAFCPICKQAYALLYMIKESVPRCSCSHHAILKPNVVLFEGAVKHLEEAYRATTETEVFMVLGSSLSVYPIRSLPTYIENAKNIIKIIINREPTGLDYLFDIIIHQDIIETFEALNNFKQ
ncbi:NAD-dependent protein deacylase [Paenibacillus oryzisoli]|uniref:NAD-dependent protein deacylase n=1 Tax=Paenibacillus oryzisoli TaxID=1850517 RepID=UPI003D295BED